MNSHAALRFKMYIPAFISHACKEDYPGFEIVLPSTHCSIFNIYSRTVLSVHTSCSMYKNIAYHML